MLRLKFYSFIMILLIASNAGGQVLDYKPSDFRGDPNYRRFSNIDGNNIRATIFNSGYSGNPNGQANYFSYEWPKNTGRIYIALISFWAAGEVQDNTGKTIRLVEMPVYKSDPGGNTWNFEPVKGFINPQQLEIARSDNKNSWPQDYQGGWRNKRTDPLDPGWPGSWNGYFGKNIFNADQEFYFVTSDDKYKRYPYSPDTTDLTRGGLGYIVDVRTMAWSQVLINDVVFFIHDVLNDGTKSVDKTAFMMFVADYVGGVGPNNYPYVDLTTAITFLTSADRRGSSAFGTDPVGVGAVKYIETPGNSVDGIDNDGDSDDSPALIAQISGVADSVCPHFVENDFQTRYLKPGDKIVLIEPNTYNRIIKTYPVGGGAVSSLGKEYVLPVGGISLAEDTVANGYDDNLNGLIDERLSIHLNHVNQYTGVVKPVRFVNYLYFPAGDTIKRGFIVPGTNLDWSYTNVAPMIDESRDDEFDNDNDWDQVLDDVGLDGVAHTGDIGESDLKATTGVNTEFPGEPNIDKTDVGESDQLGVTSAVQIPVGALNFSTAADQGLWDLLMVPGNINLIRGIGDYDVYVSSGFFPLLPGQRQRMAVSIAIAGGGNTKDDDIASVIAKMHQADLAYQADYQFASAPQQVTVTAVPGDKKVTLYWDDFAEKSFDRYINKIGGNGRNFEGYRVYRATDAAFLDAKVITDGFGVKTLLNPTDQSDLIDGVKGFSQVDINGVKFWLGSETGLKHNFVDTNVVNGQRYFYAVTAYNFGYPTGNIAPAETPIQVSVSPDGSITHGINVAIVRPTPGAAGYLPPQVSSFTHTTGGASGTVGIQVVDPIAIKNENEYRISFTDTTYKVNNKDFTTTKSFTLKNITNDKTLLSKDTVLTKGAELPVTDGFRLSFYNIQAISLNSSLTGWNNASVYSFDFDPVTLLSVSGFKSPNDYKIVFGDVGIGTSKDTSIGFIKFPSKAVNFKLINQTQKKEIPFAFSEADGNDGKFSINPLNSNLVDAIYFLETNSVGKLQFTWQVVLNKRQGTRNPQAGDTLNIILYKPFLSYDTYTFKMYGSSISKENAKSGLANIKVVPNPYLAAETWEPRNTYSSGRGPREIHFINLPMQCTIRIFNVSGALVKKIDHSAFAENGTEIWDVLSDEKFEISYGVYVYHVEAPGVGQKTGTFAIIK